MKKFEFMGSQEHALAARIDKPEGNIKYYALFAHCFTCTKDIFAAGHIAQTLTKNQIAVVRFDFTGLGQSDGDFANTNFTSNIQDLIKAADYMRDHMEAPALLIGHSLGGTAVLAAAKDIPEVKAVATIGAPADSAHVAHNFQQAEQEILEKGGADVRLAGRPFTIKKQFIDDIKNQKMESYISNLGKALMVMHAPLDNIVGIENAAAIFGTAKHPKSYVSLDSSDHLLSRREDAEYAARVIAMWAERYIS